MKHQGHNPRPPKAHGRPRRWWVTALYLLLAAPLLAVALVLLVRGWTHLRYGRLIYSVETVPPRRVAIVYGAAVWGDGQLSPVLADRVRTGVALYHAGRVEKLLMTGDNSTIYYNEPTHMGEYAQSLGVPAEDIILDFAGRRTYDSNYRAWYIFGVDEAILVSQAYHLDRALAIAHAMGIDAVGVSSDLREYTRMPHWRFRELLATPVAWLDLYVLRPEPILGEPLPIFDD